MGISFFEELMRLFSKAIDVKAFDEHYLVGWWSQVLIRHEKWGSPCVGEVKIIGLPPPLPPKCDYVTFSTFFSSDGEVYTFY